MTRKMLILGGLLLLIAAFTGSLILAQDPTQPPVDDPVVTQTTPIEGDMTTTPEGDMQATTEGDMTTTPEGDMQATTEGDMQPTLAGTLDGNVVTPETLPGDGDQTATEAFPAGEDGTGDGVTEEDIAPTVEGQFPATTEGALDVTEEPTDGPYVEVEELPEGETRALTEIADNLESYVGLAVTVEESLVSVINERAFYIENNNLLNRERIMVIYDGEMINGFTAVRLADANERVRITGTVREFFRNEIESEFGITFNTARFEELEEAYEGRAVIVADTVTLAEGVEPDPFDTIGDINDDPQLYYGVPVEVQAQLVEVVGMNAYIMEQGNLFETNRVLVIYTGPTMDFTTTAEENTTVQVSGVVQPYTQEGIEQEYAAALNLERLADYEEGSAVIIADTIEVMTEE